MRGAAALVLGLACAAGPGLAQVADLRSHDALRVCADPAAAPMSMQDGSGFENRIAELDYKFSEAMAGRGSSHAAEIEERIAEVSERLSRTEQQLSSLETLERAAEGMPLARKTVDAPISIALYN